VYKFDQRAQTRTAFATLDKKEMIKKKEVKQEHLEKAIADLNKQILEQKNVIAKVYECLDCLYNSIKVYECPFNKTLCHCDNLHPEPGSWCNMHAALIG
jgi:uncharacterized coiled-coil protein SlyX